MATPYTLRKTKGGPRMMTLTAAMEQRFLQAPPDAVRLTLQVAFQAIQDMTGDAVVLNPQQHDRLTAHLDQQPLRPEETASQQLIWRWFTNGARYLDTQGMDQFLEVATDMIQRLRSEPLPTC